MRRTFAVWIVIAMAGMGWGLVRQLQTDRQPQDQRIEGQIVDGLRGTPVSGAQVISDDGSGSRINRTYSDALGRFSLSKSARNAGPSSLIVRAPGYAEWRLSGDDRGVPNDHANTPATPVTRIALEHSVSQEHSPPDLVREFTSGPVPSGQGADFRSYSLCSDPPDSLPKGYVVKSVQFNLIGDRQCNAWATCSEQSRGPAQVCWQFSLQGHSECNALFKGCASARTSQGVLHVTYGFVAPASIPDKAQVVYVQFASPSAEHDAALLCDAVARRGYACPTPVLLRGQFSPGLRWFDSHDEAVAGELSDIASRIPGFSGPDTAKQEVLSARPVGAVEIWLNGPVK